MPSTNNQEKIVLPLINEDPVTGEWTFNFARFSDVNGIEIPEHIAVTTKNNKFFINIDGKHQEVFKNTATPEFKDENGDLVACDVQVIVSGYEPSILNMDGTRTRVWLACTPYERGLQLRGIEPYRQPVFEPVQQSISTEEEKLVENIISELMNSEFSPIGQYDEGLLDSHNEDPSLDAWFASPQDTTSKVSELLTRDKLIISESEVVKKTCDYSAQPVERKFLGKRLPVTTEPDEVEVRAVLRKRF